MAKTLARIGVKYGIIGGFSIFLSTYVIYALGRHPFLIIPIIDFRILIYAALFFILLREYRDFKNGGILNLWQGLIGSGIALIISTVISSLLLYLFTAIDDNFLSSYIQALQQKLLENADAYIEKVSRPVFDAQLAKLPHTKASDLAIDYFFKNLMIGLLLSVLFSVVLRKIPKQTL